MREIGSPRGGWFKVREKRRGKWLPARIDSYRRRPDRRPILIAYINERAVPIDSVWLYGREIDEDEYQWLKALTAIRKR